MKIDDRFINRLVIAATIIYATLVTAYCIIYHLFPGQEFIIVFVSLYAISRKWSRRFVRDWVPFIVLFVGYESMYGFADNILGVVHVNELINLETRLFGAIPTLVLQQYYRNIILDYICTFLYSLHFVLPVVFGFLLWRYSPKNFRNFTAAFLICSYGALITFLLFPSAPHGTR